MRVIDLARTMASAALVLMACFGPGVAAPGLDPAIVAGAAQEGQLSLYNLNYSKSVSESSTPSTRSFRS